MVETLRGVPWPLDQLEIPTAVLGVTRGAIFAGLAPVKTALCVDPVGDLEVTVETALVERAIARAVTLETTAARVYFLVGL